MAEIHYLISDASKKVDVESHVLRYWEDELELKIPRTEMGHRYYTDFHIRLFRQIKDLKEKGYQLKAIKGALSKMIESDGKIIVPDELLEEELSASLKESDLLGQAETALAQASENGVIQSDEKMERFQSIMSHIIGQALDANNERLSSNISELVNDKVGKELEYLLRISDEREEERFRQLDETLRAYQKERKGQAEAAASKIPFFKRKRFGRSGKKL